MKIAILGLGEAGSAIAADLASAGLTVAAWDPNPKQVPPGVTLTANDQTAISNADIVLSINLASIAVEVARSALPALTEGQLYADLNTASPGVKRDIAGILRPSGALFADVALLAPVPGRGLRTPTLASGPGAKRFHDLLTPYGMPVTLLDMQPGSAAAYKLVRSIFMKGIAAVVLECLEAAEQLNCVTWTREQLLTVLRDEALIDRFVDGTRTHAIRRIHEMEAAAALLAEIEVASYLTTATIERLETVAGQSKTIKESL